MSSIIKKLYFFFSFFFLIFFFLIQKIILIRIGIYYANKIGHLIGNSQIYLYKKKLKKFENSSGSLFKLDLWITKNHGNFQILNKYYRGKLIFFPFFFLYGVYKIASNNRIFKKFLITEHDWGMDFYNLIYKKKSENILNGVSIKNLQNELKKISIYPNDKIACFITRNDFYNKNILKETELLKINKYRNSNFNDYLPAADYLRKKGYKIIRMGSHDKKFKSKFIINYPISKINNYLVDIYLLKKSKLIISSGTGIDLVASQLFKKKICFVNLMPYLNIQNFKFIPNGVFLTKKLIKNRKILSLKDIVKSNYFSLIGSQRYQKLGIKILDNSKKEILEAVKEFYKINFENYRYNKKELFLHKKFYKILNNLLLRNIDYLERLGSSKNVQLSLKEKARANFSIYFLKNYRDFLKS